MNSVVKAMIGDYMAVAEEAAFAGLTGEEIAAFDSLPVDLVEECIEEVADRDFDYLLDYLAPIMDDIRRSVIHAALGKA